MKLWIRTQDKKRVCLVEDLYIHDNIRYKEIEETEIIKDITGRYIENKTIKQEIDEYISCEIWRNNHLLGTYNTQEEGLKILDEIQRIINAKTIIKFNSFIPQDQLKRVKDAIDRNSIIELPNYEIKELVGVIVYEMPKEEKKDDKW